MIGNSNCDIVTRQDFLNYLDNLDFEIYDSTRKKKKERKINKKKIKISTYLMRHAKILNSFLDENELVT